MNDKILGWVEPIGPFAADGVSSTTAVPIAWYVVLTVGPALLLLRRYQRIA